MKGSKLRAFSFWIVIALSILCICPSPVQAQNGNAASLTVRITGARNAAGRVRVFLFRSADGFPGNRSKALYTQEVQIDPKTMTGVFVFAAIPVGTYAISLFHDENMNGKMDKNLVGMPKEGYGASRNPPKRMRPPAFDETSFVLKNDQTLEIKLLY